MRKIKGYVSNLGDPTVLTVYTHLPAMLAHWMAKVECQHNF